MQYLHHTAWEVSDVDEVGRGATAMLDGHPERHAWGMGRHHIGSNMPDVFEGSQGLYSWGPPPPEDWMLPEDIAAGMMGLHANT